MRMMNPVGTAANTENIINTMRNAAIDARLAQRDSYVPAP